MKNKRSISDDEIALIKAMLKRNLANKEIQFFFNRPDRPVNSGRISTIKTGNYSNSASIPTASDETLDEFLKTFKAVSVTASVSVTAGESGAASLESIDKKIVRRLFTQDTDGSWRLSFDESDTIECKESFGFKPAGKWLRAVAALSNNSGGYVLFGVKDKIIVDGKISQDSHKVVGMETLEFETSDPVKFTQKLKAAFDPTPIVHTQIISFDGRNVGVIHVEQHSSRPVIAVQNVDSHVREGDIYYRYPGQSARIKYSDLRSILDDRDRQAREQVLPMLEKLISLGPRNSMVANLTEGTLDDGSRSFVIDNDLLEKLKFIREGEFDEKKGDPTLRLVGNVQTIDQANQVVRTAFVTPNDLIEEFLNLNSPYDPTEYIRCAVEGGNGSWLPMHYYAQKAGLSRDDLGNFIMQTKATNKRRELYRSRALGKISAFHDPGGTPSEIRAEIDQGVLPTIVSVTDAANLGRAIAGLKSSPPLELITILSSIKKATSIISGSNKPSWMSTIRRGLARLDELYFADQ